jgi:hypothetical protein
VSGDYDRDGISDIAVYRPSTAHWFILKSGTGFTSWDTHQWGQTGDMPVEPFGRRARPDGPCNYPWGLRADRASEARYRDAGGSGRCGPS